LGDEGSELMSDTSKLVQPCHVQPEASPAAQQWNNAEDTWGVVVVHGVGETQPGATVNAFVPTLLGLEEYKDKMTAAEPQEVELVVDPSDRPSEDVRFPMHLRRVLIRQPRDGTPRQAVFAEVFWADLAHAGSSARPGKGTGGAWPLVSKLASPNQKRTPASLPFIQTTSKP
jgi:hypothetical protein